MIVWRLVANQSAMSALVMRRRWCCQSVRVSTQLGFLNSMSEEFWEAAWKICYWMKVEIVILFYEIFLGWFCIVRNFWVVPPTAALIGIRQLYWLIRVSIKKTYKESNLKRSNGKNLQQMDAQRCACLCMCVKKE